MFNFTVTDFTVANSTSTAFLHVVGSKLIQKYFRDGSKLVRIHFRVAEKLSPSNGFINEIDFVGTNRYTQGHYNYFEFQTSMCK